VRMGFQMQPYGIQSMLKEGHKHLSGLDEAVIKNIDACKQLSAITRTSLGPNGIHFFIYLLFFTIKRRRD
jgi:T-complex protein 1 subunit theta